MMQMLRNFGFSSKISTVHEFGKAESLKKGIFLSVNCKKILTLQEKLDLKE